MEHFHIEALSQNTLEAACTLADSVFPNEEEFPHVAIRDSLTEQGYTGILDDSPTLSLHYWLAVEERTSAIIGIIGLYELETDANEAVWIGWFCVHPEKRGTGVGRSLIDFVIEEAKKRKKKCLRVYTSGDPSEKVALDMYLRKGFTIIKRTPLKRDEHLEKIDLELPLLSS